MLPPCPSLQRWILWGSRSRDLHVANQREVPGGKGGFVQAAQSLKADPAEKNFRAIAR